MSRATPRFRRPSAPLPAAVPNLFQLSILGSIEGQLTVNTYYYADGGAALTQSTEANLWAGWATAFQAHYLGCISSDWQLRNYKVQCLTSPARQPSISGIVAANGTGPAGHEPTTVCGVILRRSLVKGAAGRGRVSIPAVPITWVLLSQLNATGGTAYQLHAIDIGTAFTVGAITYVPQVVSRKNKLGPVLGASPVIVTQVDSVLGSCRRRKLGRGK